LAQTFFWRGKPFVFPIKTPGPFSPSAAKTQIGGGGGNRKGVRFMYAFEFIFIFGEPAQFVV
jgi:hypothetical protein